MTFESMVDNTSANAEVAVKVSFGDEMRRASFNGGAYVALHELVAKMFELDQASFVVKYQDEDGDKITMSSDGEMKEALQLAKEKKLLRLFVELKPQVPKADEAVPPPFEIPSYPCGAQMGFGARGRGGAFGPGHHGHHGHHGPHGPHGPQGHHGPHRGFHGPHGHGFRGGFGGFGFGGRGGCGMRGGFAHYGRFGSNASVVPPVHAHAHAPVPAADATEIPNVSPAPVPQAGDPNANYHTPHMFAHGSFSPVEHPFPRAGPYAARCAFKEHKHAMKEHIKFMKMNAATPEDRMAIEEFKEQMKSECKARWHAVKEAKKEAKKDKKCEKKDKKWEKSGKHYHPYASHVADITIPDNSELPVDAKVTKTWRIRNEGHVAWPTDSQLIFLSRKGDNLNGPERVFVGSVEPQQEVDVSVTFITPSEPGRYKGYYRMANGDGEKFGQRVWVSFIIPTTDPVAAIAQEAEKIALLEPTATTTVITTPAADVTMD